MPIIIFLLLFGYGWASLLPNGCPEDFAIQRLLPHENDSGKFYKCSNGQRFLMRCPGGLSFDEETQICDWPQDPDSTPPGTTSSDSATTSTTFVTNGTTTTTLPINTTTTTTTTTTPSTTFVTNGTTTTILPTNTTTTTTTTTTTLNHTTTVTPDMTTTSTRPIPPVDCPEEWQVKLILPEDSACEKYFHCSDNIKLLLKCPKKKRRNFDMVFSANYTKTFDLKDF